MTLQQQTLLPEQDLTLSPSFQVGSRVNHIALAESVKQMLMSVIYGQSLQGCFAKLGPDGLWEKTYQGYSQVTMDGSSEAFSETWPKWGIALDGLAFQLSEPVFEASALPLWPRPIASDGIAWKKNKKEDPMTSIIKVLERGGQNRSIYYFIQDGLSSVQAAEIQEMMMGFPRGWTDLRQLETP